MSDRLRNLMTAASEALEDGRDPFSDAFLSEHQVTLDECYDLSEALAFGARLWINAMDGIRSSGLRGQAAGALIARALTVKEKP